MNEEKNIPLKGMSYNGLVKLYNESESGLAGFEKILNIYSHLNEMKIDLKRTIEAHAKEVIRDCLTQVGEDIDQLDELLRRVQKKLYYFHFEEKLCFEEWCKSAMEEIPLFKTPVNINGENPNPVFTYAEILGTLLSDCDAEIYLSISSDINKLRFVREYAIVNDYPNKLNKLNIDDEVRRQKELEKKKLDKVPGKHDHRAEDFREKKIEFKRENPEKNATEIREMIMDWYKELTEKDIGHSALRHHLGEK